MAKLKVNTQKEFKNKKAYHDFIIEDTIEAGIELRGSEVKSIRDGRLNLKDSHVRIIKGEMFLLNAHISYLDTTHASFREKETRPRKLLLHRKQIDKMYEKVTKDGYTIVVTKIYFNANNFIKAAVSIAKGKKLHDKREALKEKDMKLQTDRILKAWNR
ncbi:MAG: SsrA-binding protein SmpB [Campylobacterales bacterium]|nr:SsrA-binding protein SmpB [Campylobacterales bacterium]